MLNPNRLNNFKIYEKDFILARDRIEVRRILEACGILLQDDEFEHVWQRSLELYREWASLPTLGAQGRATSSASTSSPLSEGATSTWSGAWRTFIRCARRSRSSIAPWPSSASSSKSRRHRWSARSSRDARALCRRQDRQPQLLNASRVLIPVPFSMKVIDWIVSVGHYHLTCYQEIWIERMNNSISHWSLITFFSSYKVFNFLNPTNYKF